jgi:predicted small lipoprotein YifL
LAFNRLSISIAATVAVVAALGLSGCGRKGPLELPPSNTTPAPQTLSAPPAAAQPAYPAATSGPEGSPYPAGSAEAAQAEAVKNGFDSHGNPVAAPGQKTGFFLDFLLK